MEQIDEVEGHDARLRAELAGRRRLAKDDQ
jgi:hypothetical protein